MRRWLLIIGVVLAAVVAADAYAHQNAPRPAIAQTIGVLPRTPFRNYCAWFVRDTPVGALPTGRISCTWYRPLSEGRRAERDELSYNVVSRKVKSAQRSWKPLSRARLRQDIDSVRSALKARGGVPSCRQWTRESDTGVREFWRFPDFEVEVFADGGILPGDPSQPGPRWFVFLRAEPGRVYQCRGAD